MRIQIIIAVLLLASCKNQIDINNIERRKNGLTYIKGKEILVDGEVVRKFENGKIAELYNYRHGKPIGKWYAYGFKGETVSHGFGVDAKKYEPLLKTAKLNNSVLSLAIEGSYSYATMYLDNAALFDSINVIINLSKYVFKDYDDYKIDDLLLFDDRHEYMISRTVTENERYIIDTKVGSGKKKVSIR